MTINFHNRQAKALVTQLLKAGLDAADPAIGIRRTCKVDNRTLVIGRRRYRLSQYERIVLVGAGKAAGNMAEALQKLLGNNLDGGIVVVKDLPTRPLQNIEVRKAGHPTPDFRSQRAAKKVQKFVSSLTREDLLIALISGGASSLLTAPVSGLTLKDKQSTTQLLLKSGATIQEINVVRKHLSTIKGGQLASSTSATIISLILSDVLGDDLATIGSGITAPDPSTFLHAQDILQQHHLWNHVPIPVKHHLKRGMKGTEPETPKSNDPRFKHVQHAIIGNNQFAIQHIKETARQLGLHPFVQKTNVQDEAKVLGNTIASLAIDIAMNSRRTRRPGLFIWGGEPTVTVSGQGKGGRAQECALSVAIGIAGLPNIVMAGFGTDGSDGPTDVAGAIVDEKTILRAKAKNLEAKDFLKSHDSYTFFKKAGGHIKTGPTGTNVNDIYLLLVP